MNKSRNSQSLKSKILAGNKDQSIFMTDMMDDGNRDGSKFTDDKRMTNNRGVAAFDRFLLRCESLDDGVNDEENMRLYHYVKKLTQDFDSLRINFSQSTIDTYQDRIQNLSLRSNQVELDLIYDNHSTVPLQDRFNRFLIDDDQMVDLFKNKANINNSLNCTSNSVNDSTSSVHNKYSSSTTVNNKTMDSTFGRNKIIESNFGNNNDDSKFGVNQVNSKFGVNQANSKFGLNRFNSKFKSNNNPTLSVKDFIVDKANRKSLFENNLFNNNNETDKNNRSREIEDQEKIKEDINSNLLSLAKDLKKNFQTTSTVIENDFNNISETIETVTTTNTNLDKARKLILKTSHGLFSCVHIFSIIAIWVAFVYCVVLIRFTKMN